MAFGRRVERRVWRVGQGCRLQVRGDTGCLLRLGRPQLARLEPFCREPRGQEAAGLPFVGRAGMRPCIRMLLGPGACLMVCDSRGSVAGHAGSFSEHSNRRDWIVLLYGMAWVMMLTIDEQTAGPQMQGSPRSLYPGRPVLKGVYGENRYSIDRGAR